MEVLKKYPEWRQRVIDAIDKPEKTNGHEFKYTLEIFDQLGLLVGVVFRELVYFGKHLHNNNSEFIAWFIDGELVVFMIDEEIIINRIF